MICLISVRNLPDVLPAFTCAKAIGGNLWSICLGDNIFSPSLFAAFIGNIPLLKALRVASRPSYIAYALS